MRKRERYMRKMGFAEHEVPTSFTTFTDSVAVDEPDNGVTVGAEA